MNQAVGILEVYGLVCAFMAADSLPVPLLVTVKFRGGIADVEAAMEAGIAKAESLTGVVQHYIIANPTDDTCKMLKLNAFDKN